MSLSISGLSPNVPDYGLNEAKPAPKPTVSEQMHTLASSGQSAQQIAAALGLTTSEVDSALGIQTAAAAATAAAAVTSTLSVRA